MKIKTSDFGLAEHSFRVFNANVVPETTKAELTNSSTWQHVAGGIQPGDEIRVRAYDDSFVARLYVTHKQGSQVITSLLWFAQLEKNGDTLPAKENAEAYYELRGVKKYCIIRRDTGELVMEMIPTLKEAAAELEDYLKMLAA
jgi:hypothetical protein|tara:strand:- start:7250 stop:7678 length:429 start_codon:yes stop_codon:yes gene_type:complete